ncbi:MAG: branched-chain amino acid ABC transporter permease [Clostridiaceae bacterium]|jgi:branched-chain amino acid transport system permease protein|nr:branched-chain amino acid ABC transporter permease [Clostridiaceae bacterium]
MERKRYSKYNRLLVALAALIIVLILPYVFSGYILQIAVYAYIYILLASSLNLLIGYAGIFSMGHVGFYCVGAYTSALLATKLDMPFVICFFAAGLLAALAGAFVGFVALRLNDIFFAFATMGLSEVIRIVIQNSDFTNGTLGVTGIPLPEWFGRSMNREEFYYLVVVIVVIVVVLISKLAKSHTGRTLAMIRDDQNAAASLGVNIFKYKMMVMVLSCFIAGLAGSLYATFIQYINASNFGITVSINIIAMVAIGGMGTVSGPVIGAILLQLLPEYIRFLSNFRQIIYGAAIVISIMFAPKGLVGIRWRRIKLIDQLCCLFETKLNNEES